LTFLDVGIQVAASGDLAESHLGGAMFESDLYSISLLCTPSKKDAWILQLGGGHLAPNNTTTCAVAIAVLAAAMRLVPG
jgi:hypothetical protein